MAFRYGDSLQAGAAISDYWKEEKEVKTYGQGGDNTESEEGTEVPEMGDYFISSEIPNAWVQVPTLLHSALLSFS